MRSNVVESRPPENAEIRGSNRPYQTGYRIPERDPQYYRAQSSGHKAQENQLRLTPGEGWLALLLLGIAVYSVVFSIIFANWVDFSYSLLFSTAVGLLLGLCIAKIQRFPQAILHLAAVLLGYWLSIWLVSAFAYHISWLLLLENLRSVISGGFTSTVSSNSEMVFLFYLTFLSFFLAYFGVWLIYRARLPWLVALVYCSILLVNLNYIKQDLSYLVIILAGAVLLLIARVHLADQLHQWMREGLHTSRSWLRTMTWRSMQVATVLTVLTLLTSWVLPIHNQPPSGKDFWNKMDNAWENMINGRASLQNPQGMLQPYNPPSNFFGDQLMVTGSVHLPAGEVLHYSSVTGPHYLEGFTYNLFDGHTWTSSLSDNTSHNFD